MTKIEVVMLAAHQLMEEGGHFEVSLTDIIVRSWHISPEQMGMRGYEGKYPDSKLVETVILKELHRVNKNLCRVRRTRPLNFALTDRGKEEVAKILEAYPKIHETTPLEATG